MRADKLAPYSEIRFDNSLKVKALALKDDGSIVGWGGNYYGQASPPSGNNYAAIAAGWWHSLAIKSDGTIVCWGENSYGEATPPEGNDFTAIAAGHHHSLALKSDGSVVGWGLDYYGQASPPSGNNYAAIAAGYIHSLALKSDGSIVGWGSNSYGETDCPGGNDYIAVAAGSHYSLALKADGSIVGWGDDTYGQASPPSGNDYVAISAGSAHALALKSDGSIVGWGYNSLGQATPPDGNDFVAIAAGSNFSLALKSDGSVVGWGYNWQGQASPPAKATVVERYSYDVFGKPTIRDANNSVVSVSSVANRYMFTGREYDYETGNYYYRARYYKPTLGRFLQTDPIGYADGLNLYTYVNNNPTNFVDPLGLTYIWTSPPYSPRPSWPGGWDSEKECPSAVDSEPSEAGQDPFWFVPPGDRKPFRDWLEKQKPYDGRGPADNYDPGELRDKYREWQDSGKPRGPKTKPHKPWRNPITPVGRWIYENPGKTSWIVAGGAIIVFDIATGPSGEGAFGYILINNAVK